MDVLRVDDNPLVTPADIARWIGRSRQLIHQYALGQRGPEGFPPPACHVREGQPRWDWSPVSAWLEQHGLLPPEQRQKALTIAVVNNALERAQQHQQNRKLVEKVSRALADVPNAVRRGKTVRKSPWPPRFASRCDLLPVWLDGVDRWPRYSGARPKW